MVEASTALGGVSVWEPGPEALRGSSQRWALRSNSAYIKQLLLRRKHALGGMWVLSRGLPACPDVTAILLCLSLLS